MAELRCLLQISSSQIKENSILIEDKALMDSSSFLSSRPLGVPIEESIHRWLNNRGVLLGDPLSKQREFFDNNKEKVLNLQEVLTNSSSGDEQNSDLSLTTTSKASATSKPRTAVTKKVSSFSCLIQRRGLQFPSLDCRTPSNSTTTTPVAYGF